MRILFALLLLITPAVAQDAKLPPFQQALGQKLMEEINSNLQLRAELIQKNHEIEQLKAPKDDKQPK